MTAPSFRAYCDAMAHRLATTLPGVDGQKLMAPPGRCPGDYRSQPPRARRGAVLLLLLPGLPEASQLTEPMLPLIERPHDGSVHSGQVALPGGSYEAPESFPVDTAIREAKEEIGLNPAAVTVLGRLSSLYIPPSNFSITPVVAASRQRQVSFVPEPREVARVILADVATLSGSRVEAQVVGSTGARVAPCYQVEGHNVWGATAMILSEFLLLHVDVLKQL